MVGRLPLLLREAEQLGEHHLQAHPPPQVLPLPQLQRGLFLRLLRNESRSLLRLTAAAHVREFLF